MNNKPQLARGTRDFGPKEVAKRKYILQTIENVFKQFGFEPIETPAMEQLTTLMGKYGTEGDQLLLKILNSGNFFADLKAYNNKGLGHEEFDKTFLPSLSGKVDDLDEKNSLLLISEKGLRYDLTVPFARYVVMNQHNITMPFKRYQMQPVWRADKPQKGRYREFWQCDADVVGTNSLICETELLLIYHYAFTQLGLNRYQIKINNRKILTGIAQVLGLSNHFTAFTVALDKLDKIGIEGVLAELNKIPVKIDSRKLGEFLNLIKLSNNRELIKELNTFGLAANETGLTGINEVVEIINNISLSNTNINLVFDPTLARGLSYYTGSIFEVINTTGSLKSSIGGGGRYDNLTGIFGLQEVSGVGISFGLDRIYDVMEELNLFPENIKQSSTKVLICCFSELHIQHAIPIAALLRNENINTEIYPDAVKLKKQLGYADSKGILYALIIGDEEMEQKHYTLKNLSSGTQEKLTVTEIIYKLNS
ncbi:MAG: histidine--tRNA ligase [Bacteroidia bacterium]